MKTIITLLSVMVLLTTISSCKKSTNAVIYVQLKTSDYDSYDLSGIPISIQKERTKNDGKIMSNSYKVISKYKGITDKNGLSRIPVNNRGIRDYWFWIEATPKLDSNGRKCFYSYPQQIDKGQVNETVIIWLN